MPQRERYKRMRRLYGDQTMNNDFGSDSGLITVVLLMNNDDLLMIGINWHEEEEGG